MKWARPSGSTCAATDAIVGGPVGAAVGAVGGAIVGAAVSEPDVVRYGPAPRAGYPTARAAGGPGLVYSPYTNKIYDVRGVPRNGLVLDQDVKKLFRRP